MLVAVIMAGGLGERFWPKSTAKAPKQLLAIISKKTMIQETVARITPFIKEENIFVVTGKSYFKKVREQLPQIKKENIILEPVGRNTAACIGLSAIYIAKKYPEAIMVVLPSDHLIKKREKFLEVLSAGIKYGQDSLVTIGIKPAYPATGYGYIKRGESIQHLGRRKKIKIYKVEKFLEKPDLGHAKRFLKSNKYFWNSGMFIWRCSTILKALKRYMPSLHEGLRKIQDVFDTAYEEDVKKEVFTSIAKVSIDYGVLEKADNVLVIEGDFLWDDLGSWSSIERVFAKDNEGNVIKGLHKGIDTNNCIIINEGKLIGTIGVKDLVIVSTKNATLVCAKDKTQEVKELVHKL